MLGICLFIFIGVSLAFAEDGSNASVQLKALKEIISTQRSQLDAQLKQLDTMNAHKEITSSQQIQLDALLKHLDTMNAHKEFISSQQIQLNAQLKQLDTMKEHISDMQGALRRMEDGQVVLKELKEFHRGFNRAPFTTFAANVWEQQTKTLITIGAVVAAITLRFTDLSLRGLWTAIVNHPTLVWILPDIVSILPDIVALKVTWSDPVLFVLVILLLAVRFFWNIRKRLCDDTIMESAGVCFNFFEDAVGKKDFTFIATGTIQFCEIGLSSLQVTLLSHRCSEEHQLLGFDISENAQSKILRKMTMCVCSTRLW